VARSKKPKKPKRDEIREERILMEIVVDAYDESERAMGWYSYLEDKLHVPFLTRCVQERAISPLRVGDEVEVVGMAPEDKCQREMFVETPWEHKRTLAVPLSQLEVIDGDDETRQAVEDWHYWVGMGYGF
jgi:hypothetical protein